MAALERHLTVNEVGRLWQVSPDTVRKLFRDRPDVLKIGSPERRFKRGYISLRIPKSVLQKVHAELRDGKAASLNRYLSQFKVVRRG